MNRDGERQVDGLVIVDKPPKLSSHDVVHRIRKFTGEERIGHAGTLDPLATGVLVLLLGRPTRLAECLTGLDKEYEATVRLGESRDTDDAAGQVLAVQDASGLSMPLIEAALGGFRGEIEQLPPQFSAIKQSGRPIYLKARRGRPVEVEARKVRIHSLELTWCRPPDLGLRVVCSSGTYIRALARDLGARLGVGGHVRELRRLAVGGFTLAAAVPLERLLKEGLAPHLLSMETVARHLPRLIVTTAEATRLAQGLRLPCAASHPAATLVALFDAPGLFYGTATREGDQWHARRIVVPCNPAGAKTAP